MAESEIDWSKLKHELSKTVHPSKPVYRHVGWRNGRKVYEIAGYKQGHKFTPMRKNPYLGLQLSTGDPEKMKRERLMLRFFRVLRRSTVWWDRPGKSFWKSIFGG